MFDELFIYLNLLSAKLIGLLLANSLLIIIIYSWWGWINIKKYNNIISLERNILYQLREIRRANNMRCFMLKDKSGKWSRIICAADEIEAKEKLKALSDEYELTGNSFDDSVKQKK